MADDHNREAELRLAVSNRPDSVEPRAQLAALLMASGRRAEALAILREGTVFATGREDRLEQLAEALLAIDALPEAIETLQAACRIAPRDERLHAQLEELSVRLKDGATATRQLFNQYAAKFDEELKSLGYKAPAEIARLLEGYKGRLHGDRVIDLGCGTGLMGPYLKPYAASLIGVDLSPAMLEEARAKQVYDELIEGDVVAYCLKPQPKAALVTAADVLVYIGDLQPLFDAIAGVLAGKGLFAFTVERHEGEGFAVNKTKRVSHSETYIAASAAKAGLKVIHCEAIVPRHDRGKPVDGLLVLIERP